MCVEGRGRISRSGLTQDIKMGSCVFYCDVPHQWISQRRVSPVSVYCDGVGFHVLFLYTSCDEAGVMSCVCGMAFLCGKILVTATISYMT